MSTAQSQQRMQTQEVKLVADVCCLAEGKVLLVRYTDTNLYDHQSGWFLPDDLLRRLEHPDAAARRILGEQTGIGPEAGDLKLGYVESFTGGDRSWHLAFHYALELGTAPQIAPRDGVAEARWFPLGSLPPSEEVAHHGWALGVIQHILEE